MAETNSPLPLQNSRIEKKGFTTKSAAGILQIPLRLSIKPLSSHQVLIRVFHTLSVLVFVILLSACQPFPLTPLSPTPFSQPEAEAAALSTLRQVDDYPLYTMQVTGVEPLAYRSTLWELAHSLDSNPDSCTASWGCSLFAAMGNDQERLYGRNFDWQFSPALLLFNRPLDGYASVSMVDMAYLNFTSAQLHDLESLTIAEHKNLLAAVSIPFDGMNDQGLAIGMAAVPPGNVVSDPSKKTIDELLVIREVLDHAKNTAEAVILLQSYNIDMTRGGPPIHYLIADASGSSVLYEYTSGKIEIMPNHSPWQAATNFLVAPVLGKEGGQCWRYDLITQKLTEVQGSLSSSSALDLLSQLTQDITQWSVVYNMSTGEVRVVMGKKYDQPHIFQLRE